jgi:hypothetical protein
MFPRPARNVARYRPWLAWLVYWLLTVLTAVRLVGEVSAAVAGALGSPLAALGGLGQFAAAIVFVANMWTRVRMPSGAVFSAKRGSSRTWRERRSAYHTPISPAPISVRPRRWTNLRMG